MLRLTLFIAALSGVSYGESATPTDVLDRYLRAKHAEQPEIREAPIEVEIDASVPRLNKRGIMHGFRLVTRAGQVAYSGLRFSGDSLIKTEVIARYLSAEIQRRPAVEDLTISLVNYRFHYKGNADYAGRTAYVFRVKPRRKRVGLFKGELWLEPASALPLREWGDFVKSPSIFIKRVRFVRDYILDGNRADPRRLILTAHALLLGDVELTMWFGKDSRNGESTEEPAATTPPQVNGAEHRAVLVWHQVCAFGNGPFPMPLSRPEQSKSREPGSRREVMS